MPANLTKRMPPVVPRVVQCRYRGLGVGGKGVSNEARLKLGGGAPWRGCGRRSASRSCQQAARLKTDPAFVRNAEAKLDDDVRFIETKAQGRGDRPIQRVTIGRHGRLVSDAQHAHGFDRHILTADELTRSSRDRRPESKPRTRSNDISLARRLVLTSGRGDDCRPDGDCCRR
jgi:hypothetical protein